jgi:hypothetical protein
MLNIFSVVLKEAKTCSMRHYFLEVARLHVTRNHGRVLNLRIYLRFIFVQLCSWRGCCKYHSASGHRDVTVQYSTGLTLGDGEHAIDHNLSSCLSEKKY